MRSLIVYQSVHKHNTEKVVKVMATVLGAQAARPAEVDPQVLRQAELVGFGSGIFYGKHHASLLRFIDKLPPEPGKKVFLFSTSGVREMIVNRFNKAITAAIEAKRFDVVGTFWCKGFTDWGPFKLIGGLARGHPDADDLARAEGFARSLLESLS